MKAERLIDQYLRSSLSEAGDAPDTATPHQTRILQFFKGNPSPDDDEIHNLADELGIAPHDLETEIYKLFGLYSNVGLHRDIPDTTYPSDELAKGIDIELEHTSNKAIAKEIAKDHLAEIPDYYTRLIAMEKDAEDDRDDSRKESFPAGNTGLLKILQS